MAELRAGGRQAARTGAALAALARAELALAWRSSLLLVITGLAATLVAVLLWSLGCALLGWWLLTAGITLPVVLGLLALLHAALLVGLLVFMRKLRSDLSLPHSRAGLEQLRMHLSGHGTAP